MTLCGEGIGRWVSIVGVTRRRDAGEGSSVSSSKLSPRSGPSEISLDCMGAINKPPIPPRALLAVDETESRGLGTSEGSTWVMSGACDCCMAKGNGSLVPGECCGDSNSKGPDTRLSSRLVTPSPSPLGVSIRSGGSGSFVEGGEGAVKMVLG